MLTKLAKATKFWKSPPQPEVVRAILMPVGIQGEVQALKLPFVQVRYLPVLVGSTNRPRDFLSQGLHLFLDLTV